MRLYTDDKAEIRDAIQKDSSKRLALDVRPAMPKAEQRRHDGVTRRQRLGVLERMRTAWKRPRLKPQPVPPLSHASRIRQQERSYGYER
jgi:hypothetical protein